MDVRFLPPVPVALRPLERAPSVFQKAVSLLNAALAGPRAPIPRKGDVSQYGRLSIRLPHGEQQGIYRQWVVQPVLMRQLAERDDIIVAIRNAIQDTLGEMPWAIVPDLDGIKADLKRWRTIVECNLAFPGFGLEFEPGIVSNEFHAQASPYLRNLLNEMLSEGADPATDPRMKQFFDVCMRVHEAKAEGHANEVKKLFDKPNPSAESSWKSFLTRVLDDLTMYDAATIIKNPNFSGDRVAELYSVPGDEIKLFRRPDLGTPQPPAICYVWEVNGIPKAAFNNLEMLYLVKHQQRNGYGKSPVEAVIEQMVGTLQADAFMVEQFTNSNVPFGVFDLGPNVTQEERDAMDSKWSERVARGQQRIVFVGLKEGVKGFMPVPMPSNKDNQLIENMTFWMNRKCAAFGVSPNDIGFTQDLHRTTSETQARLTASRGLASWGSCVAGYLNSEIVKGEMWVRNDAEDAEDFSGTIRPCFPWRDVKFAFDMEDPDAEMAETQEVIALVKAGIKTINEARREQDLPVIEGGDIAVVWDNGRIKVEDTPDLPAPQPPETPGMLRALGGKLGPEQEALTAQREQEEKQNGKPPGGDEEDAVERVKMLANTLAKIATPNGKAD